MIRVVDVEPRDAMFMSAPIQDMNWSYVSSTYKTYRWELTKDGYDIPGLVKERIGAAIIYHEPITNEIVRPGYLHNPHGALVKVRATGDDVNKIIGRIESRIMAEELTFDRDFSIQGNGIIVSYEIAIDYGNDTCVVDAGLLWSAI